MLLVKIKDEYDGEYDCGKRLYIKHPIDEENQTFLHGYMVLVIMNQG